MADLNVLGNNWIPASQVSTFFNYKATQMAQLLKDETLRVAKIGKRKFIYKPSLDKFLEKMSNK